MKTKRINKVMAIIVATGLMLSVGTEYISAATIERKDMDASAEISEEIVQYLESNPEIDDVEITEEEISIETDGNEYAIKVEEINGQKAVTLEYEGAKIKYLYDGDKISATTYEQSKNIWGKEVMRKKKHQVAEGSDYVKVKKGNEVKGQYSWNSRVDTAPFPGKTYYYRTGESSYGNAYYQIGTYSNVSNKKNYNVPYYKLSSSEKSQVKEYKGYVQDSNRFYLIGSSSCTATTWGIIVAAVIVSAITIEIPIAAIITAVSIVIGGYGTAVTYCVKAYYAKLNAADEFASTKALGFSAKY